jgi:L-rhamnose mutarotase
MVIECTNKLADAMKIQLETVGNTEYEPFYNWHANLFIFDRRKAVILMNNATRYCIVLYGLKAQHFKKFECITLAAIEETFMAEGLASDKVRRYIENCRSVKYTKTHDRSIISQMNEFLIHITWKIENYLPCDNLNLVELNKWVGELISLQLKEVYPIEALRKEMANI